MKTVKTKTYFVAGLLFALGQASWVQAENVHLGKEVATTEEIIELLMPSPGNAKTRGLRLKNEKPVVDYSEEPATAEIIADSEPRSISLEIYFEFDSAVLTEEAIMQLEPVARALGSEQLESLEFELEGHTDAVGDENYNLSLSQRRAESVRDFFVNQHGVSTAKLAPVGRGEVDLLDPENPASGMNRRVTIVAR